ncbi:MAG TPA: hypothetical protein VJK48_00640 [Chlamydiales bacterium]|nr:MAG: hypothetical protein A3F67_08530 [Verrucomicrobia bacterium RIFCSPHIGHO2_12_FULL_41_10]HLB52201.1 hypothetical protein [Chlamydiales bacterium]
MSSISSSAANQQPPKGMWPSFAPYVAPPIAASFAIVPVFRDMIAKSFQQKGQAVPPMTFTASLKEGVKAAPTVGIIVGAQMVLQNLVETALVGESAKKSTSTALVSSAIVGTFSAPVLAIFNGQTMGWTIRQSIQRFTLRQGFAIAVQETAFVGGLSVADRLAIAMRKQFGSNRIVDYTAAFIAGAAGSLAGHPANTALTRLQNGMPIESARQLMWGSLRKARAVGGFSVIYKLGKEVLNPPTPK